MGCACFCMLVNYAESGEMSNARKIAIFIAVFINSFPFNILQKHIAQTIKSSFKSSFIE